MTLLKLLLYVDEYSVLVCFLLNCYFNVKGSELTKSQGYQLIQMLCMSMPPPLFVNVGLCSEAKKKIGLLDRERKLSHFTARKSRVKT